MGEFIETARQAAIEFYDQFSDEQLTTGERQALIEQYTKTLLTSQDQTQCDPSLQIQVFDFYCILVCFL
jgi:hypothetical protein